MARRAKPAKVKAKAKARRPASRQSPKAARSKAGALGPSPATPQERDRALTEALEQQRATSEILRVISSSRNDVQPVFDAIVENARRLLGGLSAMATRLVDDTLHLAAFTTTDEHGDQVLRATFPRSLHDDNSLPARAARELAPQVIADTETDPRAPRPEVARARGFRSYVSVPMLRDGVAIGTLNVTRRSPDAFAPDEIALLQTFADQAVIAIENVRRFTELEEKNRALTAAHAQVREALEQQMATAEIPSTSCRVPR